MNIGVTSKNRLKIDAVRSAYSVLGWEPSIQGYSTDSCIGEQPINDQAYQGARNRIESLGDLSDLGMDAVISIESGIFDEGGKWVDKAVVVYRNTNPGWSLDWYSEGVEFPKRYVDKARERGFETTRVGDIMVEEGFIEDPSDPHLKLTGISREKYINDAVLKLVRSIQGRNEPPLF
jgi:non-canonical (house-cleaning) NTP pyrophosphatase